MINIRKFNKINIKIKGKYGRKGLYIITFILTYILLLTSISFKQYSLKEGDIARNDIKAPRDTVNELATLSKEEEAANKVQKKYTLDSTAESNGKDYLDSLFSNLIKIKEENKEENKKLSEAEKLKEYNLTKDEMKSLITLSKDKLEDLKYNVNSIISDVYSGSINDDNPEGIINAKKLVEEKVKYLNFPLATKKTVKKLITSQIKPNFYLDTEATNELIKEAKKNTPKVIIKKNQTIVNEGEPITKEQISVLESLGLLDKSSGREFLMMYLALGVLVSSVLVLQSKYISRNHKEIYDNLKLLLLINVLTTFSLIFARVVGIISVFAIPLTFVPILLALLIDYKLSLVVCSLNTILIGTLVNFNPQIILLSVLNTILGATCLRKMQQRNDIMYSSLKIALFAMILTFSTGLLTSNNLNQIFVITLASGVGVLFSGIIAIGILPFLESIFDIVTTLKLLELSNPNNPLLKKLLMEAPGTYHHCMLVANLAEMAAEEINANPVIARVGAYFHDIGKIKRPYFFGENQMGRENPHKNINPNLSAMIIISHVKDGVELANEYKLPAVIKDIIEQHHGTTLVKYFYYTLKNNSENPDEVKEEDFKYPGPIPNSKEAGIVMLADSVEAAVRSISEPSKAKIEEMVNNIIKDKLYSGQLDNCDITLKDIGIIKKCFLKTLNGIYHQRVEYPKEKKIEKAKES